MSEALTARDFRKYNHLERVAHRNCRGLTSGTVHIFPKLDGTNASMWLDDAGVVQFGSRNRRLSFDKDNAGFMNDAYPGEGEEARAQSEWAKVLTDVLVKNPNWILYGEWLVPHTLKTYHEDSWRKFYIFDVYDRATGRYVPYDEYVMALVSYGQVIPPIAVLQDPSVQQIREIMDTCDYMVTEGIGEGIVLKNYDWINSFGHQTWGKCVLEGFQGAGTGGVKGLKERDETSYLLVKSFASTAFLDKCLAKSVMFVAQDNGLAIDEDLVVAERRGQLIPYMFQLTLEDFIAEELHTAITSSKFKNCTLDFRSLRRELGDALKLRHPQVFS